MNSERIFFTHSIAELLELAKEVEHEFSNVEKAKKLDRFYIPTRNPNSLPGGIPSRFFDDDQEAEEAMQLAKMVLELVKEKIKQTDHVISVEEDENKEKE